MGNGHDWTERKSWHMPAITRPQYKKLHLGEWLARLNVKQADLARDVDITESYLSKLISGKKVNPAVSLLLQISDRLGLSVNDLYKQPPSISAIEDLKSFSPATVQQLLDQRTRK
jgi:transcriptional regulator with XRE-family HTH domain